MSPRLVLGIGLVELRLLRQRRAGGAAFELFEQRHGLVVGAASWLRPWLRSRCGWGSSSRSCRPWSTSSRPPAMRPSTRPARRGQPIIWREASHAGFRENSAVNYIGRPPGRRLRTAPSHDEGAEPSRAARPRSLPSSARPSTAQRLDRALAALVPEFSRSYLQQLIEAGAVAAPGPAGDARPSATVHAGEQGSIELRPTPQSQAFKPEPMPIDGGARGRAPARHRQAGRPGGAPGARATGAARCSTACWRCDPQAALLPRAGIVHRLDRTPAA